MFYDGYHKLELPYPTAPGLLHFDGFRMHWIPDPPVASVLLGSEWHPVEAPSLLTPDGLAPTAPVPVPEGEAATLQYDGKRVRWMPRFRRK